MDGTKLLLLLLTVNIFLIVAMNFAQFNDAGSYLAPGATHVAFPYYTDDDTYTSFLGINITGYSDKNYTSISGVTQDGTTPVQQTSAAGRQGMLDDLIAFTGGSGSTDWLGLGAFTAMWHVIVWFVQFIIYILFAPVMFMMWMGLGATIALPIFGIPYVFLMIFLIVQFFWRFKV